MSEAEVKDSDRRLVDIRLDARSVEYRNADVEHERKVAIFDLLEENYFHPAGSPAGPYTLTLGIQDNRLVFAVSTDDEPEHGKVVLSLTPLRKIIKDYFFICDSYFQAIRNAPPSQIETIDMARRGLHNEGSEVLRERLKGKIDIDHPTARRLFTLICVLHFKA